MDAQKSPLTDQPLRNPGQSLEEELQRILDDVVTKYAIVATLPIIFAGYEWYRWYFQVPYGPIPLTIIAILAVSISLFKLTKVRGKVRQLKQGIAGEKAVGQYLERLRAQGCQVFHDVIGKGFNIDHVIISPKGIFTVETKTYSKPVKGKAEIRYQGDRLFINGFTNTSAIVQAKAEANWLKDFLRQSIGRSYKTTPIIVFPGWYITTARPNPTPIVANPKMLPGYLSSLPDTLAPEEVSLISYSLSRYIRQPIL